MKVTEIKGSDITVGTVFKPYGRWLRVVRFEDSFNGRGYRFVMAAPAAKDPRMAELFPLERKQAKYVLIHADEDYPTREQEAPVWGWVTKALKRHEAED